MLCSHCGKPITLVPSAAERALKYGGVPSDYSRLFTMHSQCQLERRRTETSLLLQKISLAQSQS